MGKKFKVSVNGETFEVEVDEIKPQQIITKINKADNEIKDSQNVEAEAKKIQERETIPTPDETISKKPQAAETTSGSTNTTGITTAPLPGKILSINVKKGDVIKRGDILLIIEAMKMENEIFASGGGTIKEIFVDSGSYVETGQKLLRMEE